MLNWGRENSWTCAFILLRNRSFEWPGVESLYRPCGAFWFAEVVGRTSTHRPEMPGDIIRLTNNIQEVIIKKKKKGSNESGVFYQQHFYPPVTKLISLWPTLRQYVWEYEIDITRFKCVATIRWIISPLGPGRHRSLTKTVFVCWTLTCKYAPLQKCQHCGPLGKGKEAAWGCRVICVGPSSFQ